MLLQSKQEYKIANNIDKEFYSFISFIKKTEISGMENIMKRCLILLKQQNINLYEVVLNCYNELKYWGALMPENNVYELLANRALTLKNNWENIVWLYNCLEDYRSKKCLHGIISHWVTFDAKKLDEIRDHTYKHYFDLDIINCDENEIFVDLGAYTGDTIIDYISTYSNYKKIYCYEIVPKIFENLKENLKKFNNIEFRQKGAYASNGCMRISDTEPCDSMHKLSDAGQMKIPTVSIDEDIQESITFVKMDIEGGEQDALRGCKNHIQADCPKLAISIYHNHEDIWKCAAIINEIIKGYKFYIRYYGGNVYPSEYVLLAVHEKYLSR